MNDRVPAVRLSWVRHTLGITPALDSTSKAQAIKGVTEKLQDVDAKVREKTIALITKFIESEKSARHLDTDICTEIGERCRDKNEDVRIVAMELLCKLVHAQYTLDPYSQAFATCVNSLFKLIYTNDRDLRIFYEYFIEHSIMISSREPGSKISGKEHALFLTSLYRTMNEEARKAFKKWLNDKSLFVRYFEAYVKIAAARPDDPRLAPLNQHLSNLFRTPLDALVMLQTLPTLLVDREIHSRLAQIGRTETGLKQQKELTTWIANKDWEQRDGRLKGFLMTFLARRASLYSINGELITAILAIPDRELQTAARKLVSEIIAEFPALGVKHADLLEDAICTDPTNVENLMAYAKLAAASGDKVRPREELLSNLLRGILESDRRQAKYTAKILSAFGDTQNSLKESVKVYFEEINGDRAVSAWQILAELANHTGIFDDIAMLQPAVESALWKVCSKNEHVLPPSKELSLSSYSNVEVCAVLAIRCMRNMLLSLREAFREREAGHLRIIAPLMVDWLRNVKSARVQLAIAKALLLLVPRPTSVTLVTNLSVMLDFAVESPALYRDRLLSTVMRQYHLGHIGMIYLLLPLFFTEIGNLKAFKEAFWALRKNDRFADAVLPLDDATIEISSRSLCRYEDVFILALVIVSVYPVPSTTEIDDNLLARYSSLVDLLVELFATEVNISYLFDATVQLKRLRYAPNFTNSNSRLYVLSELSQNALRGRANSHKWVLQAIKSAITISDDLLHDLPTEEMSRNINRPYLVRVTQKLERSRKSDESRRDENVKDMDNMTEGASVEVSPNQVLKKRRSERNNKPIGTS
jgi:hypothetical protein